MNYYGHDYSSNLVDAGVADPHVATVIMTWRPSTEDGGHGHLLLKKPGGFFVGTRPECEIALGTVGLLAVLANQYDNTAQSGTEDHRRLQLGESSFDLVLHPQTITPKRNGKPAKLGEHPGIRTIHNRIGNHPVGGTLRNDVSPLGDQEICQKSKSGKTTMDMHSLTHAR